MSRTAFFTRGWTVFAPDAATQSWAQAVAPLAERMVADPSLERRCGGTWFPGVNILENAADGGAPSVGAPALGGAAVDFIASELGFEGFAWDQAQISGCAPGYPQPGAEETPAAARYRRDRAAAHVDGLLPVGEKRRRVVGETHGFILGLPLSGIAAGASPLVVWEGSHEIIREGLRPALAGVDPRDWAATDVTEAYHAARRRCFDQCARVEVSAPVGSAYLVHRLALHGVAPWTAAPTVRDWRIIAYFRPDPQPVDAEPEWWLTRP